MNPEIVAIEVLETLVVETTGEVIEIHDDQVEAVEVAEPGPPGPPGTDEFDTDLTLIYEIAKL